MLFEFIYFIIYRYKNPTFLEDVDIDKVLVSNKIYSREKDL